MHGEAFINGWQVAHACISAYRLWIFVRLHEHRVLRILQGIIITPYDSIIGIPTVTLQCSNGEKIHNKPLGTHVATSESSVFAQVTSNTRHRMRQQELGPKMKY